MSFSDTTALSDFTADGPDEITVPFRRHRGKTVLELAREDDGPRYLRWARSLTDWGEDNAEVIEEALRIIAEEKIQAAPPITLTDHQAEVADKLLNEVAPGRILRLEGGAGYGKSFVTKKIATELISAGYQPHATAVSYVATQVLAGQLDPYGVPAATLARTLKFKKDFTDGREVYDHSIDTPMEAQERLSEQHALIIDECSMINDRDAALLTDTVRRSNGLLIVVGDSAQLPPVKQKRLSMFCTDEGVDAVSTLTVPMRYSTDSDLYRIEQTARINPWELPRTLDGLFLSHEVCHASSMDALLNSYVNDFNLDPGAVHRMLLFRRADVVKANNAVREALFGPNAAVVEADEQLMVLATTDTPFDDTDSGRSVRYYSGQTFRVLETRTSDYHINIAGIEYVIPHYEVRFDNGRPSVRIIFGITENQMDPLKFGSGPFQEALTAAIAYGRETDEFGQSTGSWLPYRQLQSDFLRVAYTYATSVHRCQGQTVDYAYCEPQTLLAIPGIMGRALAYVACTRAKKRLTLLA